MKGDIGDVIAKRVKGGKLIVNGIGYPPQWPVGNSFSLRGEIEGYFFKIPDGRIFKNEGNVIKYELIMEGVGVNECYQ